MVFTLRCLDAPGEQAPAAVRDVLRLAGDPEVTAGVECEGEQLLGKGRFLPVRRGFTLTGHAGRRDLDVGDAVGAGVAAGARGGAAVSYEQNLITDEAGIRAVVQRSKRVAVLGIKTEAESASLRSTRRNTWRRRAWR